MDWTKKRKAPAKPAAGTFHPVKEKLHHVSLLK